MEAKLNKLTVADLKDILEKHSLPKTGNKGELVKRIVENKAYPAEMAPEGEAVQEEEEELVEPPADEPAAPAADEALPSAPEASMAPEVTNAETPAGTADTATAAVSGKADAPAGEGASTPAQELTPEQQAMKARAERFGLPFNPNGSSASTRKIPAASTGADQTKKPSTPAASTTPAPAAAAASGGGGKKGAIDRAPLGIDAETLAKRAAKFGLPEKKPVTEPAPAGATNGAKKAAPASSAPASKKAQPQAAPVELTEEQKARQAEEEEKKRKRAEKFGTAKPAASSETKDASEPEAKKTKV